MTNPYAFVPLGDQPPERGMPTWHSELRDDCLSGAFLVDISVSTPMLIGEAVEGQSPPTVIDESDAAATMIPGSTLAGSIRAVHEALSNSCLRVLDLDYVPVHRQFMSAGVTSRLRMAVVTDSDSGLPARVQLLDKDPLRIAADVFASGPIGGLSTDDPGPEIAYSGMRLSIAPGVIQSATKRARAKVDTERQRVLAAGRSSGSGTKVFPSPVRIAREDLPVGTVMSEDPQGQWVLYVSDTRARTGAQVWFRAGKIPSDPVELRVGQEVRSTLARAIEGASDMHRFREGVPGDLLNVYTPEDAQSAVGDMHAGPVIGRRRRVHKGMFEMPGFPVWVSLDQDESVPDSKRRVTEIRLAQAWRTVADGDMATRAGGWTPCRQPADLCPSCAVFGSAGVDDVDSGQGAQQNSYRGHVRIGDARFDKGRRAMLATVGDAPYRSPKLSEEFTRRPLGSPKPTAGQFYLDSGPHAGQTDRSQPLAQWGSAADGERNQTGRPTAPRSLAGRKFYWATTSAQAPDKGRGAQETVVAEGMVDRVRVVLPGSGFTARITVDNLTRVQIGALLAAIDTRLLGGGWKDTVGRLGGGRPFGWGAVTMRVDPGSLDLRGPKRYTDDTPSDITVEALVSDFLMAHPAVAGPPKASPIDHLRRILTLDVVRDENVAYPAGAGGDVFDFWKGSAGISVRSGSRDQHRPLGRPPLPLDAAPDASA